ncbi:hypothetical protein BROUX41_002344 [Berkeleyomyces rouxiae]|uniref:uncharacterized protein n=1 Tax=Berkeleyomyces rouxiae TaxID=2035830 RepID=UPI003B77E4AD
MTSYYLDEDELELPADAWMEGGGWDDDGENDYDDDGFGFIVGGGWDDNPWGVVEDDEFGGDFDGEEEDDEDAAFNDFLDRSDPRTYLPTKPDPAGRRLMESGKFGSPKPPPTSKLYNGRRQRNYARNSSTWLRHERETGMWPRRQVSVQMTEDTIPKTPPSKVMIFPAPIYSGQFSRDGNFFFSASRDFWIRLYDTNDMNEWKIYKSYRYPYGNWTLTDATLSPDNRFIAYCTLGPLVALGPTSPEDSGAPVTFDVSTDGGGVYSHNRLYSMRFGPQGTELVCGASDGLLLLYDLERSKLIQAIEDAHGDDVNAVCYADPLNPNILLSGSDDSFIKLWDRRCMRSRNDARVLVGHNEGITYLDSREDMVHVLSNGKDQCMKLWDLRHTTSTHHCDNQVPTRGGDYDYRMGRYRPPHFTPMGAFDTSLVTIGGRHRVMRSLIRCYFSPAGQTSGRYLVTGSADGQVYVFNLDGTVARTIDVAQATQPAVSQLSDPEDLHSVLGWQTVVRDVAWHPTERAIVASAFNGPHEMVGTLSMHIHGQGSQLDKNMKRVQYKAYNDDLTQCPISYQRVSWRDTEAEFSD